MEMTGAKNIIEGSSSFYKALKQYKDIRVTETENMFNIVKNNRGMGILKENVKIYKKSSLIPGFYKIHIIDTGEKEKNSTMSKIIVREMPEISPELIIDGDKNSREDILMEHLDVDEDNSIMGCYRVFSEFDATLNVLMYLLFSVLSFWVFLMGISLGWVWAALVMIAYVVVTYTFKNLFLPLRKSWLIVNEDEVLLALGVERNGVPKETFKFKIGNLVLSEKRSLPLDIHIIKIEREDSVFDDSKSFYTFSAEAIKDKVTIGSI